MTTLTTDRLVLRPPRPEDADAIAAHLSDFGVAGNLARVPHPYSRTDAEVWLARLPGAPEPGETSLMIETRDGLLAGNVGFRRRAAWRTGVGARVFAPASPPAIPDADPVAIVGYYLGRPFWDRGLMTEALTAALAWYFEAADADGVACGAFHFNAASLAIQRKLGFVETGRSTVHCLARGEDIEHIDTKASRAAFSALTP